MRETLGGFADQVSAARAVQIEAHVELLTARSACPTVTGSATGP